MGGSSAENPAPSPAGPGHDDAGWFRGTTSGNMLVSLIVASLLPTGAFGVVAKSNSSLAEKIDTVISRLDKFEGANVIGKMDDHEGRIRVLEHRLDLLEAKAEAKAAK